MRDKRYEFRYTAQGDRQEGLDITFNGLTFAQDQVERQIYNGVGHRHILYG
jgi:hypothetical protein